MLELRTLEEQPVLLGAESSLQLLFFFFLKLKNIYLILWVHVCGVCGDVEARDEL